MTSGRTASELRPKPRLSFWDIWNMSFGFLGIQFGFALQNANVSRIFETLGASVEEIPILWVAAPVTGLLVQPVIGYFSDRTWTRLGRRRPYFLVGAVFASLALVAMPNSPTLWVAAGMLWIMDASINVSMEPFRAFVGDNLPSEQRTIGFAMQSFFIGTGAVIASVLPWVLTTRFGVANEAAAGLIPDSVRLSFYLGAVIFFLAVLWTVAMSREYSPDEMATFAENREREETARQDRSAAEYADNGTRQMRIGAVLIVVGALTTWWLFGREIFQVIILSAGLALVGVLLVLSGHLQRRGRWENGFVTILNDFQDMPGTMKQLAWVQFFSWFALFAMWIYTTAAVTSHVYGTTDTTSAAYNEGANWVGVCFAVYNGVAALVAFLIPILARRTSRKIAHALCLTAGAAGFLSIVLITDPLLLLVSMIGVGIAWASILSMPYAILTGSLPPSKLGYYMGVFNFFIVIPQIVAAAVLGFLVANFLGGQAINALVVGGGSLLLAAVLTLRVEDHDDVAAAIRLPTDVDLPKAAAVVLLALGLTACSGQETGSATTGGSQDGSTLAARSASAEYWNAATIYFLLTDRFANGDPSNDLALGRSRDGAPLRSFEGGDLRGLLEKIEDGYFDELGVNAIWMTPFVEQIRGSVDEGTGKTYGFHGYWTRDWTAVDPALGTEDDLRAVVEAAHARGIKILMDAVLNHTGPVTSADPVWPEDWVRTGPRCSYADYATTVRCTLVANLPDVRTERDAPAALPEALTSKWTREGRLEAELAELDAFFAATGHPRAPRFYIIKWLTDWVRELGLDGYRVDTAKHIEEAVSAELRAEADRAFAEWKAANPAMVVDDLPFFFLGEVYNYELDHGRLFDFGDRSVDFFAHGYDALINFGFKRDGSGALEPLYSRYSLALGAGALQGRVVVNYASSHDDGSPLDPSRERPFDTGTRLLLAPGAAQIYYGDEVARPLRVPGAEGDANLRSSMPWDALAANAGVGSGGVPAREVLAHWRTLGRFRAAHPAVGAGTHHPIQDDPHVFGRTLGDDGQADRVVVGLGLPVGPKRIPLGGIFPEGAELVDAYSGAVTTVAEGHVTLDTPHDLVLLQSR